MSKKLIYLILFVLAIASLPARAGLIHHWKFDEDTAAGDTIAVDSVGGLNGTIQGAVTAAGKIGNALSFDGSDDSVEFSNFIAPRQATIIFWMNPASVGPRGRIFGSADEYEAYVESGLLVNQLFAAGSLPNYVVSNSTVVADAWIHVALVYDGTSNLLQIYIDGVLDAENSMADDIWSGGAFAFGHRAGRNNQYYNGLLDDFRIFDHILTQAEIELVMKGVSPALASNPSPVDGQTDVPRDVVLSWTPGIYAPPVNGHKIYLSESFNDVNDGVGGIATDANSYDPGRLNFGKTHYWRVDEVNGPPDYTVHEGSVWNFTTEPFAYAIESITATASSMQSADMGPENTINGSGLDDNDLHSKDDSDMWLSSIAGPQPTWIQYEFDKVYKLHQIIVWNSNQAVEPMVGFGFKDVTIEYSANGTDYTTLGTSHEFAQAPGAHGYAHNTTVDFDGTAARYVRLTAKSNWGGILNQYGLSEVRFLYIPVHARESSPDSGATDVDVDVIISWRAGREAAQHDVYLGTNEQAVLDGTVSATTVAEPSHGPLSLDLGQTYYWRVDEVNEAEIPATWQGDIWGFTAQEFLVVDDFESYNDLDPTDPESNRIFNTWIDGYQQPTNGSVVGYENPPFAEQTIVHSGKQSMPLAYSNTGGAAYSEAELTLSPPQDWTKAGAAMLVLYFHGSYGNTGQLYVEVDGSKVVYDGDAADIAKVEWKQWNIALASVGTNLQNVTKLSVGIDGSSATGTLYVDDIRLYRLAP